MVETAVDISYGVLQKQWIKANCYILILWYFERVFISKESKLFKVLFIFRYRSLEVTSWHHQGLSIKFQPKLGLLFSNFRDMEKG